MLNGVIREEELRSDHRRGWMIECVVHESPRATRGRNGVVVEEDHELTGRRRDSGVASCSEATRGLVANDENAIAVWRKQRWGRVGRPSSTTTSCRPIPSSASARSASRHCRVIVALLCTGMTIEAVGAPPHRAGVGCAGLAEVIVKENVRTAVGGHCATVQPIAILVGHQRRALGDGLELIGRRS